MSSSLQPWIDDLASAAPTPGGGAAAAMCGALGAALVSMVARLTAGRPRYASVAETVQSTLSASELLRRELSDLAEADATAFGAVAAAYRLPKSTGEQQVMRQAAIQAALLVATEVPLRIAEVALSVLTLARTMAEIGNRTVRSDAGAAALMSQAALRAALLNVDENLRNLADGTQRALFVDRVAAVTQDVDLLVRDTLKHVAPGATQGEVLS